MNKRKILVFVFGLLFALLNIEAQPSEGQTFGGWMFLEVNYHWKRLHLKEYIEHDNLEFNRFECWYSRTSVAFNFLPFLEAGVNYVPLRNSGGTWEHFFEVDLIGTLKSGDFKVTLRERFRHGLTHRGSDELRSRLKVSYAIPGSHWGVYMAPEVFTHNWEWKKTRHYLALTYDVSSWMQIESYYMFYAFRSAPSEHVIGLGLNLDFW